MPVTKFKMKLSALLAKYVTNKECSKCCHKMYLSIHEAHSVHVLSMSVAQALINVPSWKATTDRSDCYTKPIPHSLAKFPQWLMKYGA